MTDFHKRKLFQSSFIEDLKLMILPNKELLVMKDQGRSILSVNGVESTIVIDGKGGKYVESALVYIDDAQWL